MQPIWDNSKNNEWNNIVETEKQIQLKQTTDETKTQNTQIDWVGLEYKNEDDGFSFTFDKGYKNLWYSKREEYANGEILRNYTFYIKNAPNPDIFVIHVFKTSWWSANAETDKENKSWLRNTPRDLSTALGIFLWSNKNFTFTLWPNNQTCPDLWEKWPGPLCKLTENKIKMITESFKMIQ